MDISKIGHNLTDMNLTSGREQVILYISTTQRNIMNYNTTIANMLINPNHRKHSEVLYNNEECFMYALKDNTLYYLASVWSIDLRKWIEKQGIIVPDSRRMYMPIAKLEDNKLIGYNTQHANMGNKFLEIDSHTRSMYYPNLYYVEIGNHPYPKEARLHHQYQIGIYHKECHKLLNPPSDPKEFFLEPSLFSPSLRPH